MLELLPFRRNLAHSMGVDESDVHVSIQKKHITWAGEFLIHSTASPGNVNDLPVNSFLKKGMKYNKDGEKSQYCGSVPGLKDWV